MINKTILHECHKEGFKEEEIYGAYKLFFGTLTSQTRLRILNLLRNKELTVTDIMNGLDMDQTAVSHDLSRLKSCGFVNVEVKGKFRVYSINEKTIKPILSLIDAHMSKHCIHILRRSK